MNKFKNLFVLSGEDSASSQSLSKRLGAPLISLHKIKQIKEGFYLAWQDGRLMLFDVASPKKGLSVEFDARCAEQASWPAPKSGPLAQAIGRKTQTVVDATAGWGQDCFHIFRMGYQVHCIERSKVMAELLRDGLLRLEQQFWMQQLKLKSPQLIAGNAIEVLKSLDFTPDCIYLDPMFPPKRKKSALAKKAMVVLKDIVGNDDDRGELFASARQATGRRVVVKSPDYAESIGGKPNESFSGKLVRYDVYLK